MKHWLYPANPKYYDIISAFTKEEKTAWPMNSKVDVGDCVFIYSGAPYKQILFKCEVVDINLSVENTMHQAEKYAKVSGKKPNKDFMLLKTVHTFEVDSGSLGSFSALRENGLKGSIMGPQRLENNESLFNYFSKLEWI